MLETERAATVVITGHALIQNIRRRHYQLDELGIEQLVTRRLAAALSEPTPAI